MADDVDLNLPTVPGGKKVASEDIGGKQVQRVKLVLGGFGTDGGDVASGNPVPVAGAVTVSGVATVAAQGTGNGILAQILAALGSALTFALPTDASTATAQATAQARLDLLASESKLEAVRVIAAATQGLLAGGLPAALGTAGGIKAALVDIGTAATQTTLEAARVLLAAIDAKLPALVGGRLDTAIGAALPAGANAIGKITFPQASKAVGATVPVDGVQIATGACSVYTIAIRNTTGGNVYIQVHDTDAAPSPGSTPDYFAAASTGTNAAGSATLGGQTRGFPFTTGARFVLSSTQDTYTAIVSTSAKYSIVYAMD